MMGCALGRHRAASMCALKRMHQVLIYGARRLFAGEWKPIEQTCAHHTGLPAILAGGGHGLSAPLASAARLVFGREVEACVLLRARSPRREMSVWKFFAVMGPPALRLPGSERSADMVGSHIQAPDAQDVEDALRALESIGNPTRTRPWNNRRNRSKRPFGFR